MGAMIFGFLPCAWWGRFSPPSTPAKTRPWSGSLASSCEDDTFTMLDPREIALMALWEYVDLENEPLKRAA